MKNIAVFFADGFEEIEALTPVDYLRRAGLNVIMVQVPSSTTKEKNVVTSSHNVKVITDMTLEEFFDEYKGSCPDCCICPGGLNGAKNLGANKELLHFMEDSYLTGHFIAAICASPALVLGKTNILKDKYWTCYPGMEIETKREYMENHKDLPFLTDGTLVTGRGPGASEQFAMELVRIFAGEEKAAEIKKGSCLR